MVEAITIYLAAGAPFGVSDYLGRKGGAEGRAYALLKSVWATMLWPVAATTILLARTRRKTVRAARRGDNGQSVQDEKVEQVRRQLLATLHVIQEQARALSEKEGRRSERVACVVRESVEKYVGLTLGARGLESDSAPTEREMELYRIAGRTGDDLLRAGRCIHRRNVARLIAHREQARTNLLHALAEVRELATDDAAHMNGHLVAARHMSVAILRFYGQAINLLSLLEDEDAARKVARLLDAECSRLRRLEAARSDREPVEAEHPAGEEQCKPHTPQLAFIGPSPNSPLTRG